MIDKISTPNAPGAIGPYSQGVVFNNLVFTSGQIAINPQTNRIEAQTIEEQAEQVMKNLKAILEAAGSGLDKVIKTTCFLSDMKDFEVFNSIYEKYITTKPARSCVAVKQLPKNVLVEVEAIAVKE
ncbi:MAG TPA: RidA family protein [Clostridiales bacterium]|nr:RidA family protein [Clostridiales bacterium]